MVAKKKPSGKERSSLKTYAAKRNFMQSPEPPVELPEARSGKRHGFVIHKHAASRLHYDLRLECDGVLCSWAIPRGPSMDPLVNRLSVRVEDHPLRYRDFETVIPPGNYGAGTMMVWDEGDLSLYETLPGETHDETFRRQYRKGSLKIELKGHKVRGRFTLVKLKDSKSDEWLLIKKRDAYATSEDILLQDLSVKSGLSLVEIAASKKAAAAKAPEKSARKAPVLAPKLTVLLKGVKKADLPEKIAVMKPKKSQAKLDVDSRLLQSVPAGMPCVARVNQGQVELRTTVGLNVTPRFREISSALASLPDATVLLGIATLTKPSVFHVFDILQIAGRTVAQLKLKKRLEVLSEVPLASPAVPLASVGKLADANSGVLWARDWDAAFLFGTSTDAWLELTIKSGATSRSSAAALAPTAKRQQVTTMQLTNPSKLFWPAEKITKQDLYEYYRDMSDVILPYLEDRPESLHRHPDGFSGKSFFQKEVAGSVPGWIATTNVPAYGGTKTVTYLLCQNQETLLYMVNMGCIELNPWLSRISDLTKPDYAVIDIDPGTRPFSDVILGAKVVRRLLETLHVEAFCKTSGGRGIHIYVPTDRMAEFSDCQKFAQLVGLYLNQALPEISSIKTSPLLRRDKLYIDTLQNRKGQTMAAVYAVRPRPGAPVSTPIMWSELTAKLDPAAFTLKTVRRRLDKKGDLWSSMFKVKYDIRQLTKKIEELLLIQSKI